MGAETGIEWAHSTVNVWLGCTKVSPACKHCYAETNSPVRVMEVRIGEAMGVEPSPDGKRRMKMWGDRGFRYETASWERELRKLNRRAWQDKSVHDGPARGKLWAGKPWAEWVRPRVFVNSLSDIFEDWQGPVYRLEDGNPVVVAQSLDDARARFFKVAEECTELDILLVTKRPENVLRMVPSTWLPFETFGVKRQWPSHIWMLATVEDQEQADKRIPELLKIPAKVRGLSMEPLLGKVDLANVDILQQGPVEQLHPHDPVVRMDVLRGHIKGPDDIIPQRIHWVIVGGESGKNARPMHPDWARTIRDQCVDAGVSFFFKQWGEWTTLCRADTRGIIPDTGGRGHKIVDGWIMLRVGKKNAGRVLDGREWNEVPK